MIVELAVGAIVVHDGALLLVQRGRGAAAGTWSIPGGRVEPGEPVRDAVAREVHEETGVVVEVGAFAGFVERMGTEPAPYHYVILDFFATPVGATTVRAGDDARSARWVPGGEVAVLDLVPGLYEFLVHAGVDSLPA